MDEDAAIADVVVEHASFRANGVDLDPTCEGWFWSHAWSGPGEFFGFEVVGEGEDAAEPPLVGHGTDDLKESRGQKVLCVEGNKKMTRFYGCLRAFVGQPTMVWIRAGHRVRHAWSRPAGVGVLKPLPPEPSVFSESGDDGLGALLGSSK